MIKEEYVPQIFRIMKMNFDKVLQKTESEVFLHSATFLWLLCHDSDVAAVSYLFRKIYLIVIISRYVICSNVFNRTRCTNSYRKLFVSTAPLSKYRKCGKF